MSLPFDGFTVNINTSALSATQRKMNYLRSSKGGIDSIICEYGRLILYSHCKRFSIAPDILPTATGSKRRFNKYIHGTAKVNVIPMIDNRDT